MVPYIFLVAECLSFTKDEVQEFNTLVTDAALLTLRNIQESILDETPI